MTLAMHSSVGCMGMAALCIAFLTSWTRLGVEAMECRTPEEDDRVFEFIWPLLEATLDKKKRGEELSLEDYGMQKLVLGGYNAECKELALALRKASREHLQEIVQIIVRRSMGLGNMLDENNKAFIHRSFEILELFSWESAEAAQVSSGVAGAFTLARMMAERPEVRDCVRNVIVMAKEGGLLLKMVRGVSTIIYKSFADGPVLVSSIVKFLHLDEFLGGLGEHIMHSNFHEALRLANIGKLIDLNQYLQWVKNGKRILPEDILRLVRSGEELHIDEIQDLFGFLGLVRSGKHILPEDVLELHIDKVTHLVGVGERLHKLGEHAKRFNVVLQASIVATDSLVDIYQWSKGKLSGERVTIKLAGRVAGTAVAPVCAEGGAALGAKIGTAVDTILNSGVGAAFGSVSGGMAVSWACHYIVNQGTQKLLAMYFNVPFDEQVENAYRALGVHPSASNSEVNKAFERKVRQYHPEVRGTKDEAETKRIEGQFAKLNLHLETIRFSRNKELEEAIR